MEGPLVHRRLRRVGLDVRLERVGAETRVLGTDRTALRTGGAGQELKIYGANSACRRCGRGYRSRPRPDRHARSVSVTPDVATVAVDVAATRASARAICSSPARRQPQGAGRVRPRRRIKVKPDWAMARVGGVTFPKMLAQFEAWAFQQRRRRPPRHPDDIDLGLVDAAWSMEEYAATYDDDDMKFVGDDGRGDRPVHAERRRAESRRARAAATTSATCGWWRRYAADAADGKPATTHARARAPAGDGAAVHALRSDGVARRVAAHPGQAMSIGLREFHRSRRRAAGSSTWCRAPRCLRSTTAPRRWSTSSAHGPRAAADLTRDLAARFDRGRSRRHDRRAAARARARRDGRQAARRCRRSCRSVRCRCRRWSST